MQRLSRTASLGGLLILFGLVIGAGCQAAPNATEPPTMLHTYASTNEAFLNPERGFFTPYELPGPVGFSAVRLTGNSLVHLNIRLDAWREVDLPQTVIDGLAVNLADLREAGLKAIVRFAYNQGPYPNSEPDASKAQILRHIAQLAPLLQGHADVIPWLEAGFIGAWGEWHTSTHGLDNLADKGEILNALIAAIPQRYVQVRYPANIIELYPKPAEAAQAWVAHHNDCFLSSATDVGTYERDGVNTIERDQTYLAELTRRTPMSGETCAPNPPRSECESALAEMALLHFSAINEAYHKGILRSWKAGGCLDEINQRLGYRLALTSANFNEQVRPGGILQLTVNLKNTGFAAPVNARPLFVVLAAPEGSARYEAQLAIDVRSWELGEASFTTQLRIPSNAAEGNYALTLWLPDEAETLRANLLYAVRFANENVWQEATGQNTLGVIHVTPSAGGSFERSESFEVIETGEQP